MYMNSYEIKYQAIGGSNILQKIKDYIVNNKIVIVILLAVVLYLYKSNSLEKFGSGGCTILYTETACNDNPDCRWSGGMCLPGGGGGGGSDGECPEIPNEDDCRAAPDCDWNASTSTCQGDESSGGSPPCVGPFC